MSSTEVRPGSEDRKPFKVQIDKSIYETTNPQPTGRELLELAGKVPPENFAIYLKVPRGAPERIELGSRVDLTEPGVERFVTLPLDQTEGLGANRREFDLPAEDAEWLDNLGLRYELVRIDQVLRVIIYAMPVPTGYNLAYVDVNVRIEPGYPDTQIDMAYFHPPLALLNGKPIGALADDVFDGRVWQRWSRHRTPANPWRPGVDSLTTHFALIERWLERELVKV